MMIYSNH